MIAITDASGELGSLVIEGLLKKVPPDQVVAIVRQPERAARLVARGIRVRPEDYSSPETLGLALTGVKRLLLISGNDLSQQQHHQVVIDAAQSAGVQLIVYTSLLQLGSSALPIATEHKRTEDRIRLSGIPFVILRKTCYIEDYTANLGIPLASGAFLGAERDGRIGAAARATAAVAVLTTDGHDGKVYELAGDQAFTMAEHAHEVSRLPGKSIHYDLQAAIWLENVRLRADLQREYGERKRAEQALRDSEQRFRDYAETASDWLWETGPDHVFTHVSEQLSDFGMDRASRIGKRRLDLATDRDSERQKWREHMAVLERHEPFRNFEYICRDSAGRQRHVSVNGRPIFAADSRFMGYRGTATDLTKQREAEERLRQSEKMDAIGQLTGGVAHDFNNILTVITGTIAILREGIENRPELAAIAQLIDDAATRGAGITSQLLTFARRQPLQPRAIDVNAMVADTAKLLKPILGEHIEIVPVLETNAWSALADPSQLSAAIVNLAVNARDAMPGGGKLTLETANVMRDDVEASGDGGVKIGEFVMIAITDTGHGIPADIGDRVFEPFFTTKGVGRGTGLGLSMVYGFAKQSGGTVEVDSEEGRGTVIKLYLPRSAGQAAVKAEPVHATGTPGGHETILVVEDDALVRGYVIAQLGSLGYSTLVASDGLAALALVDQGIEFDLLFTDMILPGGMSGRDLAKAILKRRGGGKVLYTSGYTDNSTVHEAHLDPGIFLLRKPYRKSDLAQKIRKALESSVIVLPGSSPVAPDLLCSLVRGKSAPMQSLRCSAVDSSKVDSA